MASFTVRARTTTTTATLATDGRVCACGVACRKLTVLKDSPNKGRLFWSCGKGGTAQGGCSHFEWVVAAGGVVSPARVGGIASPSRGGAVPPSPPPAAASAGGRHVVLLALAAVPGTFTATTKFQSMVMKTLNRYSGRRTGDTFTFSLDLYEPLKCDLLAMPGVDVTPVPIAQLVAARAGAGTGAAGAGVTAAPATAAAPPAAPYTATAAGRPPPPSTVAGGGSSSAPAAAGRSLLTGTGATQPAPPPAAAAARASSAGAAAARAPAAAAAAG